MERTIAEVASVADAPSFSRARVHAILAVATTFLGSLLLFSLEPYVGKLLLPSFGGTPLLWNTCMVFFQVALLLGYLYALLLVRHLSSGWQVVIQLILLALLFASYPDGRSQLGSVADSPALRLLETLTRQVLLTFVVLAALTTLVQSWYSASTHSGAGNPYRLYAPSNLGSMLGLFAYPLLLEPRLTLGEQRIAFLVTLALLVAAVAGMGATRSTARVEPTAPSGDASRGASDAARGFAVRQWLRVIALTGIPSSLLLGVTNYVLTDVASLPLFWVVPLAIYLATFIIAFGPRRRDLPSWLSRIFTLLCVFIVVALGAEATSPAEVLIPLHLTVFALACLLCHGRAASLAPSPRFLPQYYLALSLGGALGGVITLLIPPLLTTRMIEYPIALVLSTTIVVATERSASTWKTALRDIVVPLATVPLIAFLVRRYFDASPSAVVITAFAPAALYTLAANTRGRAFTIRLGTLFASSLLVASPYGRTLFAERSFYGRVRVTYDADRDANMIVHGSTVHGVQRRAEMSGCAPTAYYHPTGPAGELLRSLPDVAAPRHIALVGLGSGALACYAREGERWDLFELDPVVARVAADTRYFTFLAHSAAREKRIVLGDARLALGREPARRYDLMIVDAFSSDAIPIHLLTREALEEYARTLAPGGEILFHVSNRFFHLPPILAAAAPLVGFVAMDQQDLNLTPQMYEEGKYGSEWVLLTRPSAVAALGGRWKAIDATGVRVWTDDYSNPVGAMRSLRGDTAHNTGAPSNR